MNKSRVQKLILSLAVLAGLAIVFSQSGQKSHEELFEASLRNLLSTNELQASYNTETSPSNKLTGRYRINNDDRLSFDGNLQLELKDEATEAYADIEWVSDGSKRYIRYTDLALTVTDMEGQDYTLDYARIKGEWIKVLDEGKNTTSRFAIGATTSEIEQYNIVSPDIFKYFITGDPKDNGRKRIDADSLSDAYNINDSTLVFLENTGPPTVRYEITIDNSRLNPIKESAFDLLGVDGTTSDLFTSIDGSTDLTVWVDIDTEKIVQFKDSEVVNIEYPDSIVTTSIPMPNISPSEFDAIMLDIFKAAGFPNF